MPSSRSSHSIPTPRGGGLAIVLVTMIGTIVGAIAGWVSLPYAVTLAGGGTSVALVGWLDDRRNLSYRTRLAVHAGAAAWALYWLGGFTLLSQGSSRPVLMLVGAMVSLLVITWAITSYNFMDGIDALAASEAVWVGTFGGAISLYAGNTEVAFVALLLAAGSAGFLYWNLPPARIFLGDVGSGFLGYAFVTLALLSDGQGAVPAQGWLILLAVFVFDSTITLVRRIVRGEAFTATHRESAYQRAALHFGRHGPVTLIVLLLNVVLAALCLWGVMQQGRWLLLSATAVVLLVVAYLAVERFSPVIVTTPRP